MSTVPTLHQRNGHFKALGCATFSSLFLTGLIGNSLVIYAILKDPAVQTRNQLSNLAILNLAFTDLMTTTLVCLPSAVTILFEEYPFGRLFCRMWAVFNLTGLLATVELLMVISLERYIAVGWPLRYHQWVTYPRLLTVCLYIWGSSWACSLGWGFFQYDYDFAAGLCDFSWQLFGPGVPAAFWYGAACTIWYFLVPSTTIFMCNVAIIRMSKEKARVGILRQTTTNSKLFEKKPSSKLFLVGGRTDRGNSRVDTRNSSIPIRIGNKVNSKILKSMTLITVSYFVLTFPVALIRVVKVLSGPGAPAKYIPSWVTLLCTVFQFSASIVNPLIYGLFRKDFRNSYARVFHRVSERLGAIWN